MGGDTCSCEVRGKNWLEEAGTLMGGGTVLCLTRRVHYKGIRICQNSCTGMLKIYAPHE